MSLLQNYTETFLSHKDAYSGNWYNISMWTSTSDSAELARHCCFLSLHCLNLLALLLRWWGLLILSWGLDHLDLLQEECTLGLPCPIATQSIYCNYSILVWWLWWLTKLVLKLGCSLLTMVNTSLSSSCSLVSFPLIQDSVYNASRDH